jgi:hypothetical protein
MIVMDVLYIEVAADILAFLGLGHRVLGQRSRINVQQYQTTPLRVVPGSPKYPPAMRFGSTSQTLPGT